MRIATATLVLALMATATRAQTYIEYPLSPPFNDDRLTAVAASPDGTVWFGSNTGLLWWLTPGSSFLQGENVGFGGPYKMTVHPNGSLYFTAPSGIGRAYPGGTSFDLRSLGSGYREICVGADGNLWIADAQGDAILRMTPDFDYTYYQLGYGSTPKGITAGPDGAVWFTEMGAESIGRITMQGQITEFPLGLSVQFPTEIISGPDGNLWATDGFDFFKVTPQGQISRLPLPASGVDQMASDGKRGIWFTTYATEVGHYDIPTGSFQHFQRPDYPEDIALALDGGVWFTESYLPTGTGSKLVYMAPPVGFAVPIPAFGTLGAVLMALLLLAAGYWRLRVRLAPPGLAAAVAAIALLSSSAAEALVLRAPADKNVNRDLRPDVVVQMVVVKSHEGTHVRLSNGHVTENRSGLERDLLARNGLVAGDVIRDIATAQSITVDNPDGQSSGAVTFRFVSE